MLYVKGKKERNLMDFSKKISKTNFLGFNIKLPSFESNSIERS